MNGLFCLSLCLVLISALYIGASNLILSIALSLLMVCWSVLAPTLSLFIAWPLVIVYLFVSSISPIRKRILSQPVLAHVKKTLPAMSKTEKIALEAGDVWLEKDLFCGDFSWERIKNIRKASLTNKEQSFLDNECQKLCELIDDWQQVNDNDLSPEVWSYIKDNGFFALIIPESYGGKGFSAYAHSQIVLKIATRSISVAVTVMVPNSLGPGELLMHYGTKEQQDTHLPRLATGEEIPCFALTAPNAGSDATGLTDTGVVIKDGDKLAIKLSWDKRYITLAPVATLIGVAFKLYDPDNLLGKDIEDIGITLALIPASHPGVEKSKRHSPLGLSFMNGTTRGQNVVIPLDWIIGGVDMAGEGWRMLMECLSIGRAISLPALATAAAKLSYQSTGAYAHLREQFKCSIGQFEGVQEAMGRIGGYTYLMDAVRTMSADAVGQEIKPSLISAITKYHLTEMARIAVNDAMDIHAGRGIQYGPRNYLGYLYQSLPMSITVEGANILTRNLIIFGQGAMRCHPFLTSEMAAANNTDSKAALQNFDKLLGQHIHYFCRNLVKSFVTNLFSGKNTSAKAPGELKLYIKQLKRLSYALAFVSDVAFMILGGSLKRRECLSARLGDVLSYLYMSVATMKHYQDGGFAEDEKAYVDFAITHCFYQAQIAFNDFFDNFPLKAVSTMVKRIAFPFNLRFKKPCDRVLFSIASSMQKASNIRQKLTAECYHSVDRSDSIGRLLYAFEESQKLQPVLNRLSEARRKKVIIKSSDLNEVANDALSKGVITEDEKSALSAYHKARIDALDVDEFAH